MTRRCCDLGGRGGQAFTLVEMIVAVVVSALVLCAAQSVLCSSVRGGKKTQDLAAAVQGACLLLHSLAADLDNIVPEAVVDDTLRVDDGSDPAVRSMRFKRRDPAEPLDRSSHGARSPVTVEYRAVRRGTGRWGMLRIVGGDLARAQRFAGIEFEEVRFVRVAFDGHGFVRVLALPTGGGAGPKVVEANRSKPQLMTMLRRVPVRS